MDKAIAGNFAKVKVSLLYLPLGMAILILLFLYWQHALNTESYIHIQKNAFLSINGHLSRFPITLNNLTQLGDELIFLSFVAIFLLYAPILWEAMISASLVSLIISTLLKNFFAIPRPAAALDPNSFVIIGSKLSGHNSLPSGHAITIFTLLTVLLYAFMFKEAKYNILWSACIVVTGLILVFTRVGVGAHYPLDVMVGSIAGYTSGLIGIFISRKYKIWRWLYAPKSYPFLIALLLACCVDLINKIMHQNLLVFYFSIASIIYSIYKITHVYFKKKL